MHSQNEICTLCIVYGAKYIIILRFLSSMQIMRKPMLVNYSLPENAPAEGSFSLGQEIPPILQEKRLGPFFPEGRSMDQLLLASTRAICEGYKIHFADLSTIQRKFVTHYRCNQCGLLPLYHLDLLHIKRVRCRKCGQLIAFKNKGKYGKLRKEIAFQLVKDTQGGFVRAE